MVKFDDDRLQVLPFVGYKRNRKGGQRWFHLYDKERISHTDELFWMGINQNWNYMCADCHTTDFKKNFSIAENKFHSSWTESRVSCESCHGPASGHMQWAEKKDLSVLMKGFGISLAAKPVNWQLDAAKQTLMPQQVMTNDTLIETCARCHARATRFTDEYDHGNSFLQSHIPATADPVNYHVDGQIKEEDYEYASFLQSKMHTAGVTCINCHEPHSMKIKATGNALCTSCHQPAKYDGPQHSFHKPTSTGNQCVTCHMPITTYMVVDNRLDHSIRIPRPDHSLTMGTPNACNKCHTDKPVKWVADSFVKWYGNKLPKEKTYAELLYAVSKYIKESEPSLYDLLQNKSNPAIIRATAMGNYGYYTTSRVNEILLNELKSTAPNIRLNALKALRNYPAENLLGHVEALLYDKVAAVRMEAMNMLAPLSAKLSEKDMEQFRKVMSEYMIVQEEMSHRPEGYFNRAILFSATGGNEVAENLYKDCIRRFPDFVPAYSNLADLYRQQGREDEIKRLIDMGLRRQPQSAYLHYSSGLWYIRQKENSKGMAELKLAAQYAPADAQMQYGYAIGLFSGGEQVKALQLLEDFAAKYGNQPLILDGIISMSQDMKQTEKSTQYAAIRKGVFGY
ncbi:MAG: tetratricopeptide repeat protein [Chitinophagaceae bacterium]|nr:tetratricopeptide repeat protein [Chitinophagaceae bacterium]